jgi:protein-tyrosine-phosphatase
MTQYCTRHDAKVVPDVRVPHPPWTVCPSLACTLMHARLRTERGRGASCGTWGGPQPYYGGADGFEKVLDLLEDACDGLLNSL